MQLSANSLAIGGCGRVYISTVEVLEPRRLLSAAIEPVLVNAGGGAVLDAIAREFVPGEGSAGGFTGGRDAAAPAGDVVGTLDDTLFRTHRAGASFSFSSAVPNGDYVLLLEFSEPSLAAGERQFDVLAEGHLVLDNYDIAADAGGPMAATARAVNVTVDDARLDLSFAGVMGEAIVSAVVLAPADVPDVAQPYELVPPGAEGDTALEIRSYSNLRQIGQGLQQRMIDDVRGGTYADDLLTLVETGYIDSGPLSNPRTGTEPPRMLLAFVEELAWAATLNDYIYLGAGLNDRVGSETPIAYDNPDRVEGRIGVLRGDGSVIGLDRADAAALLGFPNVPPNDGPPPRTDPPPADPNVLEVEADLRAIGDAMRRYSWDFDSRYPDDLGTLVEVGAIGDPTVFVSPRTDTTVPDDWQNLTPGEKAAWVNANSDYSYLATGRKSYWSDRDTVLAFERPEMVVRGETGLVPLLMGYGNAESREMPWAQQLIAASRPLEIEGIYDFNAAKPQLRLQLNRYGEVGGFEIRRADTGELVPATSISKTYDDTRQALVVSFPGYPGGRLPDGNYRVTGTGPEQTFILMDGPMVFVQPGAIDFFVLAGDADRDRDVDFFDFLKLRSNYGTTNKLFSDGDFDYDSDVDFFDFLILRGNYGVTLAPPSGGGSLFSNGSASQMAADSSPASPARGGSGVVSGRLRI